MDIAVKYKEILPFDSTNKTNLTITGIFTQQIHQNSSYMFRHSMVSVIKEFKVCKSVHHHIIQINHQLDATIFPVYYPDFYLQLTMFRASSRPSSVAQQLQ